MASERHLIARAEAGIRTWMWNVRSNGTGERMHMLHTRMGVNGMRRKMAWMSLAALLALMLISGAAMGQSGLVTLDDAVALALESSPTMRLAELNLVEAELGLREAEAGGPGVSAQALRQAQEAYDNAVHGFAAAQSDLALTVEDRYYAVLKAADAVERSERNFVKQEREAAIAQARFNEGLISSQEYANVLNALRNVELTLNQQVTALESARMRLNETIGLDLAANYHLDGTAVPREVGAVLNEGLEIARANRRDLEQATALVARRQAEVIQAQNEFTPPATLRQAEMNLLRAEIARDQAEIRIVLEVRDAAGNLRNAIQGIASREAALEQSQASHAIVKARYDQGLVSDLQLMDAETAVLDAEVNLRHSVYDFNLAWARYVRTLGLMLLDDEGTIVREL